MSHWTILKIEAYCGIRWEEQPEFVYDLGGKKKKKKNPLYDPDAPKPVRPDYCPIDPPSYICLEKGCEYFAWCEYKEDKYEYPEEDDQK